jgi:hypothetical protein
MDGVALQLASNFPVVSRTLIVMNNYSVEYDTLGFYNPADPSRITIPPGVSFIALFLQVSFFDNAYYFREASILKNGVESRFGRRSVRCQAVKSEDATLNVTFHPESVSAGDFFELALFQNSGSTLNVFASSLFFGGVVYG